MHSVFQNLFTLYVNIDMYILAMCQLPSRLSRVIFNENLRSKIYRWSLVPNGVYKNISSFFIESSS